jgi:hydroxyacylglutathione hydrolase
MNTSQVIRIRLGVGACYIIRERGTILVDAGPPKQEMKFVKRAAAHGIDPETISLIVVTHGHMDHVGSLSGIKTITKAPVLAHRSETQIIEQALTTIPKGVTSWGRFMRVLMKLSEKNIDFEPTQVDIAVEEEAAQKGYSIQKFGIEGRVLHTPGHTKGSLSLLLDTGEAFVGDLLMNGFPMRRGPGTPIFADDLEAVQRSVRMLLSKGAKRFFPGHGDPFDAQELPPM